MNRRGAQRGGTRGRGLLLLALLAAAGLWQCADDQLSSRPGSLALRLARGPGLQPPAVVVDSIEIEIRLGGLAVAAETVRPDTSGAFSADFALPVDDGYLVRVFAYGSAGANWPDGTPTAGVVAAGEERAVRVSAGRLAEVEITLARVDARILGISGAAGSDSLRVRWNAVAGASAYRLGWFAARTPAVEVTEARADTEAVVAWGGVAAGRGVVPSDSVLFRAQPEFDGRSGVFGTGAWRDLSLWLDLPGLTTAAPAAGESVEAEGLVLALTFDRGMDAATLETGVTWERIDNGDLVAYTLEALDPEPSSRFLLHPSAQLAMGRDYRVTLTTAVQDADGRPFDGRPAEEGLQPLAIEWSTAPYAPLQVLAGSVTPAPGESGVARDARVRVRFNRAVDPATVVDASFYLTDSWGARLAAASIQAAGDSAVWRPAALYWYATACTLHVTPEVLAADGKPLDQDAQTYPLREAFRSIFTTLPQPEGPRVEAMDPDSGAIAVPLGSVIAVEFSEPVDPASVNATTSFRLLRGGTVGIPGTIHAHPAGRRFAFRPNAELERGTSYLVRVLGEAPGGGGVHDLEGTPLDQDRALPGYQPYEAWVTAEVPPAVVTLGFEPARADTFIATGAAARLRFSRALAPESLTAQALRVERDGQPVEAGLALEPDGSVLLTPTHALDWLTRYALVADTLLAAVDGSRLDQDPAAPGHQAYRHAFTTEPESLHPAVASVAPADSSTGAPLTVVVTVDFTRAVDPATVTAQSLVLEQVGGGGEITPVAGTVAAGSLSAAFTPAAPLTHLTDYRVRVTSAVTDPSGTLPLDQRPDVPGLQPFFSVFRTTQEMIPPRVESVFPGDGAGDIDIDTGVALLFSEAMQAASLAQAFHLRHDETETPGSGTLDGTGRIYTFDPAAPLEHLTTYTVVVDTTARDRAGNALDGIPSVPGREAFTSAFTTEPDRVAPRVIEREPEAGAERVPVDQLVRYTFSEPLDPATLGAASFRVDRDETPVPGRAQLEPDGRALTWTPVALPDSSAILLEFGTTYRVTADTLLADRAGNPLDQQPGVPGRQADVAFFTTLPETLAPRVVLLLPGAEDVPIDAHPALVFSEPMDEASLLAPAVVSLLRGSEPVAHARVAAPSGDTLTLVPAAPLDPVTSYTVRVDTLAVDRHGNRLDQDPGLPGRQPYLGAFVTEADLEPPYVVSVSPPDGAVHVDPATWVVITFSEPLDPSTVHGADLYLLGTEGVVPLAEGPALDPGGTIVTLVPAALTPGGAYDLIVTHQVTDVAGNEMEHEPGEPAFTSSFTAGAPPEIVWSGGLCAPSDTAGVAFDASGSHDSSPGDSIAFAIWDWGDGARDTLVAPAGLAAGHAYACLDIAGCDGLDNDGDGEIDETGAAGCDESHRVILTLVDTHGLAAVDTAGVSFCAFLALASDPLPGARMTGPLRVALSRAADAATLDTAVVLYDMADTTRIACERFLEGEGRTLVVAPRGLHAGLYRLEISPLLLTPEGLAFDQDLCAPGRQAFTLDFLGVIKPDGGEPGGEGGGDPGGP